MHIEADRALLTANTPSVRHLTITVAAPPPQGSTRERPAVNVALVLDRSGSMDGRKIAMAREAVSQAIRLLDGRDHLSVVVYDDRVDTLLELTRASNEAKTRALRRLAAIEARGSTDLAAGWTTGARALAAALQGVNADAAAVSRVLWRWRARRRTSKPASAWTAG